MKTPTPIVDAVAFKINRDVVVDIYQICYDAYDNQQVDNWIKAKEGKP